MRAYVRYSHRYSSVARSVSSGLSLGLRSRFLRLSTRAAASISAVLANVPRLAPVARRKSSSLWVFSVSLFMPHSRGYAFISQEVYYNNERTHSGKYCYGKTPMRTFVDSLPLAREKLFGHDESDGQGA